MDVKRKREKDVRKHSLISWECLYIFEGIEMGRDQVDRKTQQQGIPPHSRFLLLPNQNEKRERGPSFLPPLSLVIQLGLPPLSLKVPSPFARLSPSLWSCRRLSPSFPVSFLQLFSCVSGVRIWEMPLLIVVSRSLFTLFSSCWEERENLTVVPWLVFLSNHLSPHHHHPPSFVAVIILLVHQSCLIVCVRIFDDLTRVISSSAPFPPLCVSMYRRGWWRAAYFLFRLVVFLIVFC